MTQTTSMSGARRKRDVRKGERDVEHALGEAAEGVLQGFLLQGVELVPLLGDGDEGVAEFLGEVAVDQQPASRVLAGFHDEPGLVVRPGQLENNHLHDAPRPDHPGKVADRPEKRGTGAGRRSRVLGEKPDRMNAEDLLRGKPVPELLQAPLAADRRASARAGSAQRRGGRGFAAATGSGTAACTTKGTDRIQGTGGSWSTP